MILGIEDETNIVYGIGDASPFKLSDAISNMITDACTPQINPDISIKTEEGKTILDINIAPGRFRPYYLESKGKMKSTYIRVNGISVLADERKVRELELEGQKISYDAMQDIGVVYDENKALLLCEKMKAVALETCTTEEEKVEVKDITIEKLEDFGVLYREGKKLFPTHAFDLLTDNKNKYAKIQCALFKGTTRDVFIDQKEFGGPIYEQVEEAYRFILRHINMGAEINGAYRNDFYEIPPQAVREMVANAIVHRSYLDDSCSQVCIFDDRIEVLSPGMLYGGLDLKTAKMGKSRCRNSAIAEAFHYMHIVEAWGTGIPRIISTCEEYGLSIPVFEEFGDGFKVTMFRKMGNVSTKVSNDTKKVSNDTEKVSNDTKKVSNDTKKVSNDTEKVSNGTGKVANIFEDYLSLLNHADITDKYIANIKLVFDSCRAGEPFGQSNVMEWLNCSKSKATNIMTAMKKAEVIEKVKGLGPGKYKFIEV